jgi:hypothetical protein
MRSVSPLTRESGQIVYVLFASRLPPGFLEISAKVSPSQEFLRQDSGKYESGIPQIRIQVGFFERTESDFRSQDSKDISLGFHVHPGSYQRIPALND